MGFQHDGCDLSVTGERVVSGKTPQLLVLEHLVRYRFAARFAGACKVLDVGCGSGHGASLLAQEANRVVGIDSAPEAILYAQKNYRRANLTFARGDCRSLPFRDRFFDVVVMFDVIEHVAEQKQSLSEIQRVLAPDGTLILSTPNAAGPAKGIEDVNPLNCTELTEHNLLELLRPCFAHVQLLYQHELSASSIQAPPAAKVVPVEVADAFSPSSAAKYFIAVCSARVSRVTAGMTLGVGGIDHQVGVRRDLRNSPEEIEILGQQLRENEREYAHILAAHQQDIEAKQVATSALLLHREEREREYAKNLAAHTEVIRDREQRIAELEAQIAELEAQNTACRLELEWLYRWLPTNRLARRLLFGRNLRSGLMARLHSPAKAGFPNSSISSVDQESEARDALEGRPLKFETPVDPKVSIIIPVHNECILTYQCLKSILMQTTDVNHEVLVIDDGSRDATPQMLSRTKGLRLFRNEESRGYIYSCNRGAKEAKGKYLLLLNNNRSVAPHWLKELVKTFESEPRAGAVGAKQIYLDGRLQEAGSILWRDGYALGYGQGDDPYKPEYSRLREVDFCSGCLLVRKDIFQELGGFDTRYMPSCYEDADLCMGVRTKGYKVLYQPEAVVYQHGDPSISPNRSKSLMERNRVRFAERWRKQLQSHDEFVPHLGNDRTTYVIGLFGSGRGYVNELILQNIGERAKYFRDEIRLHPAPTSMIYSGHATMKYVSREQALPAVTSSILEGVRLGFADLLFIYRHPLDSLLTNWIWWRNHDNSLFHNISQIYKSTDDLCADLEGNFTEFKDFAEGDPDCIAAVGGQRFLSFPEFVEETELFLQSATLTLRIEECMIDPFKEFSKIVEVMSVNVDLSRSCVTPPRTEAYRYLAVKERVPRFRDFINGLNAETKKRIEKLDYNVTA